MRLQLLMQRRYPPGEPWLSSAFAALEVADRLDPDAVVDEPKLRHAYVAAAVTFNALGITPPIDPAPRRLATRPYMVLGAGRFVAALRGSIRDARIAALPLIGAIDQFVDNPEVLSDPVRCRALVGAAFGCPPGRGDLTRFSADVDVDRARADVAAGVGGADHDVVFALGKQGER